MGGRRPNRAVVKSYQDLYAGTGLDQKERVRRRVLRKAKRYAARKKPKGLSSSSSSGSSKSSSSDDPAPLEGESVFLEESKTRGLAGRFPGALAMEGMASMKRALLTVSGEDLPDSTPRPIALMYYRNVLSKRTSGAAARELLNLCTCIDALVQSRPAAALDILFQRVKAQEAVAHGASWMVAQQMEIPYSEAATLTARGEMEDARKTSYLDAKANWMGQRGPGGNPKGEGKFKGKNKNEKGGAGKDDKDKREKGKGAEKK